MVRLWESFAKDEVIVAVRSGLLKDDLEVKEAITESIPAVAKSSDLHVDPEKTTLSAKMKLSVSKHRDKSFDEATATVNKKLLGARVERATLW